MDWRRLTPWAIGATLVFGYMHVLDEFWANWDFGADVASSTEASLMGVLPLVLGLWALAWILQENDWGYLVGLVFGLFLTWAGASHINDWGTMTGFQQGVVVLLLVSALAAVVGSAMEVWTAKPWSGGGRAAGG